MTGQSEVAKRNWLRASMLLLVPALLFTLLEGERSVQTRSHISVGLAVLGTGLIILPMSWRCFQRWYDLLFLLPSFLIVVAGFGTLFDYVSVDATENFLVRSMPIALVVIAVGGAAPNHSRLERDSNKPNVTAAAGAGL